MLFVADRKDQDPISKLAILMTKMREISKLMNERTRRVITPLNANLLFLSK